MQDGHERRIDKSKWDSPALYQVPIPALTREN